MNFSFQPASIPTLQQQPPQFFPEDLTTELRKNKFFTVAPDKEEKIPIPDELIDVCEPVRSMLRFLRKHCKVFFNIHHC